MVNTFLALSVVMQCLQYGFYLFGILAFLKYLTINEQI